MKAISQMVKKLYTKIRSETIHKGKCISVQRPWTMTDSGEGKADVTHGNSNFMVTPRCKGTLAEEAVDSRYAEGK